MLNRKGTKSANVKSSRKEAVKPAKPAAPVRRRFVLSSAKTKAAAPAAHPPSPAPHHPAAPTNGKGHGNGHMKSDGKIMSKSGNPIPAGINVSPTASGIDLTETVKTLLHLAQENGYVTYDDINDVLPDGLNPDDLDELYTKLRTLDVEIVDQAEVERAKPAQPEEDEDARLEILDDPVRMYMNQMG